MNEQIVKTKEIAIKADASHVATDIPKATHESCIKLGDLEIECAVLNNGKRVISERAMTRAFGGKRSGYHWKRLKERGAVLPVYLSAKEYNPFIDNDLTVALFPIRYRMQNHNIAHGIEATLLSKRGISQ